MWHAHGRDGIPRSLTVVTATVGMARAAKTRLVVARISVILRSAERNRPGLPERVCALDAICLAVIGLVAGVIGGLVGIGGSIVMIPAMTELLGVRPHLYQAAALIVNLFVAAPALVQHVRAGVVSTKVLRGLIPSAVIAAVSGVLCSELSVFRGERAVYLTALFGFFLFCVAGYEIKRLLSDRRGGSDDVRVTDAPVSRLAAVLVGLPTGFVSGLLGVGGGVIAVPLLHRLLGLPIRSAIGHSAATIVALSLVGASAKHLALVRNHPEYSWDEPARLAMLLIPSAIIGAFLGARLTHTLPLRWVRRAFAILLLAAGAKMVYRIV